MREILCKYRDNPSLTRDIPGLARESDAETLGIVEDNNRKLLNEVYIRLVRWMNKEMKSL